MNPSAHTQNSNDQRFQSIKLKYTQSQKQLNASPLKVSVHLPKHQHFDSQYSSNDKSHKRYETTHISPLRVKYFFNNQEGKIYPVIMILD